MRKLAVITIIPHMLKKLEEIFKMLRRHTEFILKMQNLFLELKSSMYEMKHTLDGVNARIANIEEKMCELESIAKNLSKMKHMQTKKKKKRGGGGSGGKKFNRATCCYDKNSSGQIYVQFIAPREEINRKVYEEAMLNIFPISNNKHSHVPHNDVSVNGGPRIQQWSRKMIMELKNVYQLVKS